MDETQFTVAGLQDIEQLPSAGKSQLALDITLALSLVLVLVAVYRTFRKLTGRRPRASRKLARIKRATAGSNANPEQYRSLACTIARELAEAIEINGITKKTVLPPAIKELEKRWLSFSDQLSIACYSDTVNYQPVDIEGLVDEAHYWLKQWP